jgi:hypothetical protein
MRHFIFLTHEGLTRSPNNQDIENLQVLGFAEGESETDAFVNFIQENSYLVGTDFNDVSAMELVNDKQYPFSLKSINM